MSRALDVLASFIRYSLTGLVVGAVDIGAYTLLTLNVGVPPLVANLISRALGGLVGFLGNKYYAFRGRRARAGTVQFGRFWVVFGVSMGLSELLLGVFHLGVGLGALPAKLVTEGILLLLNFTLLRQWAFARVRG